jgi:hypothetical protein
MMSGLKSPHRLIAASFLLLAFSVSFAADEPTEPDQKTAATLSFGGVDYLHRWSKNGQNEFTPKGQEDLAKWQDMITINVHEGVVNGDQLADLANRVLGNYQGAGKILRTDSKPRTPQREAEHLAVALLRTPTFLEAVFARFVLVDGVGYVMVYSHRIYNKDAAKIGEWIQANGPSLETTLMGWKSMPTLAALKTLPQNN